MIVVFMLSGLKKAWVFLLLYVDDMLIASKDKEEIRKLKRQLGNEFEMKDWGQPKKYWGWRSFEIESKVLCLSLNVVIFGRCQLSLVCWILKRFKHRLRLI